MYRSPCAHYLARVFTLTLLLLLTACGADSQAYVPTEDTVSSTAAISIDGNARTISIETKGPTVQSEKIEECVIGFDKELLSYTIQSQDELTLDTENLEFVRPLTATASAPGVDSRLFAIWKVATRMVQQVSYSIEIEIQPDKIIYRNTCIR